MTATMTTATRIGACAVCLVMIMSSDEDIGYLVVQNQAQCADRILSNESEPVHLTCAERVQVH